MDFQNLLSFQQAHDVAARGGVVPAFVVFNHGENPAVGAITSALIWRTGGAFPYIDRPAASAVRVKAGGSIEDVSGGTGAGEVIIEGLLEGTFELARATLATAGAGASAATGISFARVHRAWAADCGTDNSNNADVVIETTGGVALLTIGAGLGQSQAGFFTIPGGFDGYLHKLEATTDVSTGSATVRLDVFRRDFEGNAGARLVHRQHAISQEAQAIHDWNLGGYRLREKADVWAEGKASAGTAKVASDLLIACYPKIQR